MFQKTEENVGQTIVETIPLSDMILVNPKLVEGLLGPEINFYCQNMDVFFLYRRDDKTRDATPKLKDDLEGMQSGVWETHFNSI